MNRIAIIVNGYYQSPAYEKQANRLLEELLLQNADTFILKNNEPLMLGGKFNFNKCIFLDKDKAFANILENAGVRLYNRASAIELADNKRKTLCRLASSDKFSLPRTLFNPLNYDGRIDESNLETAQDLLGYPMIIKEAIGSLGEQVYLVKDKSQLKLTTSCISKKEFFYQEYIKESSGRSLRIYVVGGDALGAVRFINDEDFRSNTSKGSRVEIVNLGKDFKDAAVDAAQRLGLDFAAIDFFDLKEPILVEVNSNAYFEAFEQNGLNLAERIATHVLRGDN